MIVLCIAPEVDHVLLDKIAKDLYDLKFINSDQVKIQSKTSEAF